MQDESQKNQADSGITRRGHVIYKENPSLVSVFPTRVLRQPTKDLGEAYMVAPGTGEVVAQGTFGFVEDKTVDSEQFVKVYLEGIRQYGQLSKAGTMMFELVYKEISGRKGKDRDMVALNYQIALMWNQSISRSVFFRGMKELLEKDFLFRSISADDYFVNVRFMFNGDRMALVKTFTRGSALSTTEFKAIGVSNEDE